MNAHLEVAPTGAVPPNIAHFLPLCLLGLDFGSWETIKAFFTGLDLENFWFLADDDLYWKAYLSSLKIAAISTAFTPP